ncbi:alpha-1A adrenergic receptor-like [Paramacrobiotus metropolitanus]|uniref:alpha-1A adrenergic receptor-like n=1 Tax=Paramacrobiotus metropolitanus TaxID=2943436 RepID=UPI0024460C5C|nr:alpha-1A adrenergic receptor-like [Paramacrobiotus metropolitanus]
MSYNVSQFHNTTEWDILIHEFNQQWAAERTLNYVFCAVMTVLAVFGTLANIVVLLSFVILKELHQIQYAFVGNLAAADLIITAFIIPANIVGPRFFRDNPWFCEMDGTICATACAGSVWCIMAISVERYICICHYSLHIKLFTVPRTIFIILLLWMIAHLIHLPNLIGWGVTAYSDDLYLCTTELHVWSYSIFFGSWAILIPILISFYAYVQIYLRVRNSRAVRRRAVAPSRSSGNSHPGSVPDPAGSFRTEMALLKALFNVFLIFLVSWILIGFFFVGRAWIAFPKTYNFVALVLSHGSSATNSAIYFWMTDTLQITRQGCRRLWRGMWAEPALPASGFGKTGNSRHTGHSAST